ncbi:MAG: TraR/DksA C4-type zinc finger protein [Planctomycetaceae bacterium]|jgi:RNA polymerase-binding transcription factor DksA|nr:TraR/DksA C4-type zinc finger protein [Planctomycetaceae bacterium]
MKKIKKKNIPIKTKKTTIKNTPIKKVKNSKTPKKVTKKITKKVTKKITKKVIKKVTAKKAAKKSVIPNISQKKTTKNIKNITAKLNKAAAAKPSPVRGKSVIEKTKNKLIKTTIPKQQIKKTLPKTKTTIISKPKSIANSNVTNNVSTLKPNKNFTEVKSVTSKEEYNNNITEKTTSNSNSFQSEPLNKYLMSEHELDSYRQKLIIMRARLRGDVSTMTDAALNKNRMDASGDLSAVPIHMADVGSDNFEQEQTLSFMQNERGILVDIEDALVRIKDGNYGICEGCGNPIPKVRLNFIPYANMCVKCAELVQSQEEENN